MTSSHEDLVKRHAILMRRLAAPAVFSEDIHWLVSELQGKDSEIDILERALKDACEELDQMSGKPGYYSNSPDYFKAEASNFKAGASNG